MLCPVKAPPLASNSHTHEHIHKNTCWMIYARPHFHREMYHISNMHPTGILSYYLSSGLFLLRNFVFHFSLHTVILFLCISSLSFITPFCSFYPIISHPLCICIGCAQRQTTHRPQKQRASMRDKWKTLKYNCLIIENKDITAMRNFVCVCVWVWGTWEITHYFIVLVFGGKALLKLSLLPSHLSSSLSNSLLRFPSLHHFLPHLFSS